MWISKTPLRASFFGGGTDYPSYFWKQPGAVLGGTINKFVYIQALPLPDFSEQKFRITYRNTESVRDIESIVHPVVRESLKHYEWNSPLNIATMSDLPGGTGLGSSSSFTVGFLNLIHHMRGIELTRYELARKAIHMEQEVLNENVGVQDQIHAAFGGLSRYEFQGNEIYIQPLKLSTHRLNLLNKSLILVYTGIERSASKTVASQEKRTKSGENSIFLEEMYKLTVSGAEILEQAGDDKSALIRFGELLNHSWKLKQNLGSISNNKIDEIYKRGLELGAWGGKLLGAGGGGFLMFLTDPSSHKDFETVFGKGNIVPFSMISAGSIVEHMSR